MQIDLLYFDGCSSWEDALANLKSALAAEWLVADIQLIKMDDDEDATRMKFLGSPSFQVNGVDWWLEERKRYNMSCRVYQTPLGMKGVPTIEMLREKLRAQSSKNV